MKTGLRPLWAVIAVVVVLIGGSVLAGFEWGFKHWLIGLVVALGLLAGVTVEGSYRLHRRTQRPARERAPCAIARAAPASQPRRRRGLRGTGEPGASRVIYP